MGSLPTQHPWCSLPQADTGSAASPAPPVADQRRQLSAPTLGDVTPRCPKQQCVRSRFCPSVNPRLSIIDFYLLLQPRNLQDSTDVGTQSSLGLPHSRRLPGRTQAGDEGKKGDASRRKRQVPAPFPPLQTHTANMSPACNSTAT